MIFIFFLLLFELARNSSISKRRRENRGKILILDEATATVNLETDDLVMKIFT